MAESRLACLKRKLSKDENLKKIYIETVGSYISKRHAEPVADKEGKRRDEIDTCKQWTSSISNLEDVKVPRWMKLEDAVCIQLHVFCVASEKGYAACAYFRTTSRNQNVELNFAIGKAKVSPLKNVSIPRLDLLGAMLAVQLDGIVRKSLAPRFKLAKTTFLTDSMIVLGYITNETKRFKTFVANSDQNQRVITTLSMATCQRLKRNTSDKQIDFRT
ncbi:uncharacterized protein LOC117106232 [Anneissia japonica]|uniref:uncharacterized protein LOC117106232 n=1 Tax=Anneissia japonica TaxID=1529436 RepID=UPI001425919A|nr:uncharacterized protein LOC117106232 [Anneissia japonica]